MPHKCVRCGKVNEGNSGINSCDCGSKLFFFVKNASQLNEDRFKTINTSFSEIEKKKIEQDIYDIIGNELKENSLVFLDIEAINIIGQGKYELDLEKISSGKGLIYKYDEGKYIIDIAEAFNNLTKKEKKPDIKKINLKTKDFKNNEFKVDSKIDPLDINSKNDI